METAWVNSRIEFRGDSFEELALKMQHWYDVTIVFTDENVKQPRFSGSFEKETPEQAFSAPMEANSFIYILGNMKYLWDYLTPNTLKI